jgi:hypothetical protein
MQCRHSQGPRGVEGRNRLASPAATKSFAIRAIPPPAMRLKFRAAYDFTSAEFHGEFIGIVFAYADAPQDPKSGEKRIQLMVKLELAEALVEAVSGHIRQLPV